jgi:transcriptional regulator with XRE-family HTH domain
MTRRPRRTSRTIVGRLTHDLDRRIGLEVRRLRIDAGITQQALADAAGIDRGYLSQVERALKEPSLTVLQSLATALGCDLSVRLYPNTGPKIHDRTQSAILQALLTDLDASWHRLVEVAVQHPARGVIDLVLHRDDENVVIATEIESRIARLEQELRWAGEKADALPSAAFWSLLPGSGASRVSRLLVLRVTRATRNLAAEYGRILAAAYPARSADAYDALFAGKAWPGPAILWADVTNGTVRIRRIPPRGVTVGR